MIIGVIAATVAVFSLTFCLSRISSLPYFSIVTVDIYGADPDITPVVEVAALNAIQGSYLGLFSKSSTFLYPRTAVLAAVEGVSPRILSADVSRDGWNDLIVSVTEKTPAAMICAELPDFDQNGSLTVSDDNCYAADGSGLIFEKMTPAIGDAPAGQRYYIPDLPTSSLIGLYATSTSEFEALQAFIQEARLAGLKPEGVLFKDGGEYELYADNPTSTGTATTTPIVVIYMNDLAGLQIESANLNAFWSHMVSDTTTEPPSFESIDLRYGSNVFYRLAK